MQFLGLMPIMESKKITISDISADIMYIKYWQNVFVKYLTDISNGGRISYILTNFISNISALNSKRLSVIKYHTPLCWTNTELHM